MLQILFSGIEGAPDVRTDVVVFRCRSDLGWKDT